MKGLTFMNDDDIRLDDIIGEEDLSSLGELASVDSIIADAVDATDKGNYIEALKGFEQALEVTKRIFGDNLELSELKQKIADIHDILEKQKLEPGNE